MNFKTFCLIVSLTVPHFAIAQEDSTPAQNNPASGKITYGKQHFLIEGGFGTYNLNAPKNELIKNSEYCTSSELDNLLTTFVTLEWNPSLYYGIGFQHIRSTEGSGCSEKNNNRVSNTLNLTYNLITNQIILPIDDEEYFRYILKPGIGWVEYYYEENETIVSPTFLFGGVPRQERIVTYSTTGTIFSLNAIFDFGGDLFGVRFGVNWFYTNLGEVDLETDNPEDSESVKLDSSGYLAYIGFRWAI